jgi:chromosome segregation ATPase
MSLTPTPQVSIRNDARGAPGEEPHAPGALVRIKMKNFVTYALAEFKCGPSLNMIVGPNGTGKSSLVCAICLGLGWSPAQLGRAKDVGEFVKNGCREAEIEIELKAGARQRGRNPVIKRIIKREGNKSTWFVNGSSSTHKEVQTLMKNFGIQVDNLCQFLPQDKVADFAAMSPMELLEQTQKAVGTAEMIEWHDSLKKLGAERQKHLNEKGHIDKTLAELQSRQAQQKAEVDRLQERHTLQGQLNALEKHRPAIKYMVEKDRWDLSRKRRDEARLELAQLQGEVEPLFRDANNKEDYLNRLKAVMEQRKLMVEKSKKNIDNALNKMERHKEKIDECNANINSARTERSKRNVTLIKIKNRIAQLEGRLKNEPTAFDPKAFNERKRLKEAEQRPLKARIDDLAGMMHPRVTELKTLHNRGIQIQRTMEQLNTKSGKQLQRLSKVSEHSYQALQIIEDNKDKFDQEVFGPPVVTCSLKLAQLGPAVETALQNNDIMAFTVQNEKDNRTLQDLLYRQHRLSNIAIRSIRGKLSDFKPPTDDATLKGYNFEGWLIEALDGPDHVLAMLCDAARLHRVAYSIRDGDFDLDRLLRSPLTEFAFKDTMYAISRRPEYGPDAVSTSRRPVKSKSVWTDDGAISNRESELEQQLEDIERKMAEIKSGLGRQRDEKKAKEEVLARLASEIVRSQCHVFC